jgi:hypothetical protein
MSIFILRLDARDLCRQFVTLLLISESLSTFLYMPGQLHPASRCRVVISVGQRNLTGTERHRSIQASVKCIPFLMRLPKNVISFHPPSAITRYGVQIESCAKTSKNPFGPIKCVSFLDEKLQILELQGRSDESCSLSNVESWMECKEVLYHCVQQCFSHSETPFYYVRDHLIPTASCREGFLPARGSHYFSR